MSKEITKFPGTDRGHFYDVVGCGERGLVGIRDLGIEGTRVRIQGWPEDTQLPDGFEGRSPFHASTVVDEDELDDTIKAAVDYIT